jgi:hypothetical protein
MAPAGTAPADAISRLLARPEFPGMSRPLWLVMAGSIPTLLGWWGSCLVKLRGGLGMLGSGARRGSAGMKRSYDTRDALAVVFLACSCLISLVLGVDFFCFKRSATRKPKVI